MSINHLIYIPLAYFLSFVSIDSFANSDTINRDVLAKSNAECAAYYDLVKDYVKSDVKHEYIEKINTHYNFAKQLHESNQSIESRYKEEQIKMKNKLSSSSIEALVKENVLKCSSVESHTPLIIKAHLLKVNP